MDLSLISLLSFLITFQLLFVGLFLITHKKGNRRNNILLGAIFIMIGWNMGDLTLQMNGVIFKWKFVQLLDDSFFLLYGPFFYLYTQGVIFKDFKLSSRDLLHLTPYLLLTITLLFSVNITPGQSKDFIENDLPWQFYLISAFSVMVLMRSTAKQNCVWIALQMQQRSKMEQQLLFLVILQKVF